jgi:uncharacterized RDD family membrane protein YckC
MRSLVQGSALDTTVTAETPEGIALELRPAGYVARANAYLLDLLARSAILYAGALVLAMLRGVGFALILIAVLVINWLYPIIFEMLPGAATPGKRALGLMVVMDNGLPITPAAALVRNLLRAADFMPFMYGFGVATMLLRKDAKRLGDLAAGTVVVYKPGAVEPIRLPVAEPVPPEIALVPRDQAAVISFAMRVPRLTVERAEELAQLALPLLPPAAGGESATARLLGVAQWLHGRRDSADS